MSRRNIYQVSFFPAFEGVYKPSKVDRKGRASVPAGAEETIGATNRLFAEHLNKQGFPFTYKHRSIYLGNEVVATLEPVNRSQIVDEKNLVHLIDSDIIIDTTKLNRELHARTMKIGEGTVLVAYTPFDWWLYFNKETKGFSDEQKLKWAVNNNYAKIVIDAAGRVQINRFVRRLGLDWYVGFAGHERKLFIGNPAQMGIVYSEFILKNGLNDNRTTNNLEQLELPYPVGYTGGPIFMIGCPDELRQQQIFYVEEMPPVIHQRGPRQHQRGNRAHQRGSKKHGSNPLTLTDLLSPNF